MKLNDEIKTFVQDDYLLWLKTRCKYAPAIPIGMLAAMQPRKNGVDRDYSNCPLSCAFNASIMLQKELLGIESFRAFLLVYYPKAATWYYRSIGERIINVKTHAEARGVTPKTIYEMAHKFVLTSYNSSVANSKFNNQIQAMMTNDDFDFN